MADQVPLKHALGFGKHGLERLFQVSRIVRDAHNADLRALPGVLMIQFGDRHVKSAPKPVFEAPQHLPFVLERARVGDMNFERQEPDWHSRTSETAGPAYVL